MGPIDGSLAASERTVEMSYGDVMLTTPGNKTHTHTQTDKQAQCADI